MSSPMLMEARVSFRESLELAGRSPATLALYDRFLKELESWLSNNGKPLTVEEVESSHVRGFLLHLSWRRKRPGYRHRCRPQGGLAPETLRGYYRTLSCFFAWCKREGLLNGREPMRNVRKPSPEYKEMTVLTDEEVGRFLTFLDKPSAQKRTLYVAFSLMWRLGLRVGEVCQLRLSGLNVEAGSLLVRGKGKKQRRLPVSVRLRGILQSYVEDIRPKLDKGCSDALLLSCVGKRLRPGSLSKSYRRYAGRAGVPGTPHLLRHSFATRAARSGEHILYLQKVLGHSSVTTTERYFHCAFEDLRRELDKLEDR